MMQGGDITM
jgi:cyclophilin family peptidyl-prolyl cis-trans isomerase